MKYVTAQGAPQPIGPYSQAVISGGLVFCSGQIGLDASGSLVQDDLGAQARQALENLTQVLRTAGSEWSRVARVEVFMTDLAEFAIFNEIYETYFAPDAFPARVTVGVAELPRGARVEVSCVAETGEA